MKKIVINAKASINSMNSFGINLGTTNVGI
jgi:hypothetical protein